MTGGSQRFRIGVDDQVSAPLAKLQGGTDPRRQGRQRQVVQEGLDRGRSGRREGRRRSVRRGLVDGEAAATRGRRAGEGRRLGAGREGPGGALFGRGGPRRPHLGELALGGVRARAVQVQVGRLLAPARRRGCQRPAAGPTHGAPDRRRHGAGASTARGPRPAAMATCPSPWTGPDRDARPRRDGRPVQGRLDHPAQAGRQLDQGGARLDTAHPDREQRLVRRALPARAARKWAFEWCSARPELGRQPRPTLHSPVRVLTRRAAPDASRSR